MMIFCVVHGSGFCWMNEWIGWMDECQLTRILPLRISLIATEGVEAPFWVQEAVVSSSELRGGEDCEGCDLHFDCGWFVSCGSVFCRDSRVDDEESRWLKGI